MKIPDNTAVHLLLIFGGSLFVFYVCPHIFFNFHSSSGYLYVTPKNWILNLLGTSSQKLTDVFSNNDFDPLAKNKSSMDNDQQTWNDYERFTSNHDTNNSPKSNENSDNNEQSHEPENATTNPKNESTNDKTQSNEKTDTYDNSPGDDGNEIDDPNENINKDSKSPNQQPDDNDIAKNDSLEEQSQSSNPTSSSNSNGLDNSSQSSSNQTVRITSNSPYIVFQSACSNYFEECDRISVKIDSLAERTRTILVNYEANESTSLIDENTKTILKSDSLRQTVKRCLDSLRVAAVKFNFQQ